MLSSEFYDDYHANRGDESNRWNPYEDYDDDDSHGSLTIGEKDNEIV